jgi:hypothetical protein
VRRYPDGTPAKVSRDGGSEPVWDPSGRMLYFRDGRGQSVRRVTFQPADPPVASEPRLVFSGNYNLCNIWCRSFDISPDGRRFVVEDIGKIVGNDVRAIGTEIRIVPRWDREVAEKMKLAKR